MFLYILSVIGVHAVSSCEKWKQT